MNTKHTPGPWIFRTIDDTLIICANLPDGAQIHVSDLSPDMSDIDEARANARRIVACVNALEGVTTEELESGAFKAEIVHVRRAAHDLGMTVFAEREESDRLREQRDELLAALESVIHDLTYGTTGRWKGDGSAQLRALIAKCDKTGGVCDE